MKGLFIGGCDRSGTTMLGSMLGAAENSIVTPESQFVWNNIVHTDGFGAKLTKRKLVHQLSSNWRFRIWGLDIKEEDFDNTPGDAPYKHYINRIVTLYANERGITDPDIWIDHTPASIENIQFLSSLLEEAKFIHLVRDGRAIASSFKILDWGPNTIKESALWWKSKISYGLAAERKYDPRKIMLVRYEDVLNSPENELRKICEFANMEYRDEMISGGLFDTPNYTKIQHKQVGGYPDGKKAVAWRQDLTEREIETFEYETGELLAYLGYKLLYGVEARPPTRLEKLKSRLYGFSSAINLVKQRYRRYKTIDRLR